MKIFKHHSWQYCKLIFLTVLLGNYIYGVLQQSAIFIPMFGYSLSIKEHSNATFPKIPALSVTECTLQCFSQPFCKYFTYKDGFCQIYHVLKDEVTAKEDPNEEFYFSLDADLKWHRIYFIKAGSRISTVASYKTHKYCIDRIKECSKILRPKIFRSSLIDTWKTLPILEVKLTLQKNEQDVVTLKFNGTGSGKLNWFKNTTVLDTPWTDLGTGLSHFTMNSFTHRKFVIDGKSGDCDTSEGWLSIINNSTKCNWYKDGYYPYIIYSNKSTKTIWKKGDFGEADSMEIYIRLG